MKPDVLVVYPLLPRQMTMLEDAYTVHRLDLLEGTARDALLADAGKKCTAMVVNGHVAIDDAFLARLPALKYSIAMYAWSSATPKSKMRTTLSCPPVASN